MVSILKEIDITKVFNHFAPKKCINHNRRKAYAVCLHEDCWNSESNDKAFFCGDCNMDHLKKHGDSLRFDALFTDELFDEFDDYIENQPIKDKLKQRINKFEQAINELHRDIEERTRFHFAELKKIFESHFIETHYFEAIRKLKKKLRDERINLSFNYEIQEKVKTYCIQIQKIQDNLNDIMNKNVIDEASKKDEKMDQELDSKLQLMGNIVRENVKNQLSQLSEYLIDCTKKSKLFNTKSESLRSESTIQEVSIPKIEEAIVKKTTK